MLYVLQNGGGSCGRILPLGKVSYTIESLAIVPAGEVLLSAVGGLEQFTVVFCAVQEQGTGAQGLRRLKTGLLRSIPWVELCVTPTVSGSYAEPPPETLFPPSSWPPL